MHSPPLPLHTAQQLPLPGLCRTTTTLNLL